MSVLVPSDRRAVRPRTQSAGDLLQCQQTRDYFAQASRTTDPDAKAGLLNQVVLVNLPVADGIARRYAGRGIVLQDLAQVARLGLVLAVRRFDPDLGSEFLSFAVPTIRGELKRHFRDRGWAVRPPRQVQELRPRILEAASVLAQRLGRSPTRGEVATLLGVDETAIGEALVAGGCFAPASLDRPLASDNDRGDASAWGATLGMDDPELEWVEAKVALTPLFHGLCVRDRRVLQLRFVEELTQQQIGEVIGVSQMQVSRILARLLQLVRNELAA